jgi:hypothetical protein
MNKKLLMVSSIISLMALLLAACETNPPNSVSHSVDAVDPEMTPAEVIETATTTKPTDVTTPTPTQETRNPTPEATEPPDTSETTADPEDVNSEDEGNTETNEETPTLEVPETVGPENYPKEINPLTGLPVEDPALLELPPALISISNFPASARPQAGLNSSPFTFEIAIGEGMTRFLAMFYGDYPSDVSGQTEGTLPGENTAGPAGEGNEGESADETDEPIENASIGPIRSGRLPYEDVRSLYSGFLVMASAWEGVAQDLSDATSVFGNDGEDINSAMVGVDKLQQIAQSEAEGYNGSNFNLEGLQFSQAPPQSGQNAGQLWVFYSLLNQIQWRYDEELNAYVRYDIKTDGSGEFVLSTDRLTGEPVSKENVIVVYAEHDYRAPTLIDIDLINRPPTRALLFRDGQIYEIFWTTRFGNYEKETGLMRPMRFVDAEGSPFPLKPGQTWLHIVSLASYHRESAINDQPFHPIIEQPGSGLWLVRYKGKY